MSHYTTRGSVRGCCGHAHTTIRAAVNCLSRDQRGCYNAGGYSDRSIEHVDGTPLSDWETKELDRETAR